MANQLIDTLTATRRRELDGVRAAAERIWSRPLHRYFTDHTVTHSRRVITLLDGLTGGMMATGKRLSPTEAFVLLAAAYLHDVGMQDERVAGGDLEEIRARHHETSAEMIYASVEGSGDTIDLGLPRDPGLVDAVAQVARGHRRVDLQSAEYDALSHGSETLRLRLLAALLRFGDELDVDHRRVDLEQMKRLNLPPESALHWWTCHYVSGVAIVDEYITVTYRLPPGRPDYEQLIVPLVEADVRDKHRTLEPILRAHAVKVALGPSTVRPMRGVQPLDPQIEALAREALGTQEDRETPVRVTLDPDLLARRSPAEPPPSTPPARGGAVFDMRGATIGKQVNVAGDYTEGPPAGRPEEPDAPGALAAVLTVRPENGGRPHRPGGGAQWFSRLVVESSRPLEACEGWVRDLRRLAGLNDWNGLPLPAFTASRLSWAVDRGAFAPVQIQPRRTYYLDVAWRAHDDPDMPSDELRIASGLDEGPRDTAGPDWGVRQDFIALRPGYYLIKMRLLASGYDPLDLAYILHWPGAGREDDVELREVAARG